jgi:hypothetical protein
VEEGSEEVIEPAAGGGYRQGKMKKAKGKNGCASATRAAKVSQGFFTTLQHLTLNRARIQMLLP